MLDVRQSRLRATLLSIY